jgi:hypothetical protein
MKAEGKVLLVRRRRRREYDFKMNLKGVEWEGVE